MVVVVAVVNNSANPKKSKYIYYIYIYTYIYVKCSCCDPHRHRMEGVALLHALRSALQRGFYFKFVFSWVALTPVHIPSFLRLQLRMKLQNAWTPQREASTRNANAVYSIHC